MKLLQFVMTLSALLHSTNAAAVACQEYPQLTSNDAINCCKVPDPKWEAFPSECNKYMAALKQPTSPCSYECFFNVTNSFKDGKFNATVLRPLVSKLYDDKVFQGLYNAGFEKCSFMMDEKTIQLKRLRTPNGRSSRKRPNDRKSCSPLALKYFICAHAHVYVNCPAESWAASTICRNVKNYAKNCRNSFGGQRNNTELAKVVS